MNCDAFLNKSIIICKLLIFPRAVQPLTRSYSKSP